MRLTNVELDVLAAAAKGETATETAARLGRPVETVKSQRSRVIAKLGVRNIVAAVAAAHSRGLLGEQPASAVAASSGIREGQLRAFHAKANAVDRHLGLPARSARTAALAEASRRFGREIQSAKDLTADEASEVLDMLDERLPRPEAPAEGSILEIFAC